MTSAEQRLLRQLRITVALLSQQIESLYDLQDEPKDAELGLTDSERCEHPERERDNRVRTFDQPGRWQCKRCGFIGGETAAVEARDGG